MSESAALVFGGKDFQLESFKNLGVRFVLIQNRVDLTEFQSEIALDVKVGDYEDQTVAKELIDKIIAQHQISSVFSFTEFGLEPAGIVAAELGVPTNCNLNAVRNSRDKGLMRECLSNSQCSTPLRYLVASTPEEVMRFHEECGKIVLKPLCGTGSRAVSIASDSDDIRSHLTHYDGPDSFPILCEEFVGGEEFSLETMSGGGEHRLIAVTKKLLLGGNPPIGYGYRQPPCIEQETLRRAEEAVFELLELIGHLNGAAHTEVKIQQDEVFIIETQTRTGGSSIWQITELTSGICLYEETIKSVLSHECAPSKKRESFATASAYYPVFESGKVKSFSVNLDDFEFSNNVHFYQFSVTPGQTIARYLSVLDRVGFVVFKANSIERERKALDGFMKRIEINYE